MLDEALLLPDAAVPSRLKPELHGKWKVWHTLLVALS